MPKLTFSLGGQSFEIGALTVGQIEAIQDALVELKGSGGRRTSTDREVLAAALAKAYPEMTTEKLKDLPAETIGAITDAAAAVLRFAGFIAPEKSSGEAHAATG